MLLFRSVGRDLLILLGLLRHQLVQVALKLVQILTVSRPVAALLCSYSILVGLVGQTDQLVDGQRSGFTGWRSFTRLLRSACSVPNSESKAAPKVCSYAIRSP